ncbi:MAG: putative multidrug export ATP-binding/permease protein [Acidobacteria bacterium]|nr:putative multidrug export ATP-binding/permease protein [Acidobacteriota bacterium]
MAEESARKPRLRLDAAWREARALVWTHRRRLSVAFALLLVGRLAGLALPASSKFLIDEVVGAGRRDLLLPLALAAGVATLVQAATSYALSQLLGVAAQREIAEMRQRLQAHVLRLPTRFFDATKSGELISRVMNDAEGIRNLVGTGLVQLAGGLLTAALALAVLFWLEWRLTLANLIVLGAFGGGLAFAFRRLRPIFRERSKIFAEVNGRLGESMGGVRVVKAYTAEPEEERVFGAGVSRLFANIRSTMTGISAVTAASVALMGAVGTVLLLVGGRSVLAGRMTLGDLVMYVFFTGLLAAPAAQIAGIGTQLTEAFAGLDRIREILGQEREDAHDGAHEPVEAVRGEVEFEDVGFEYESGRPVLTGVSFRAAAGTTTALVGSSGSGKSTLIGLVLAFHHPQRGVVRVDGRNLSRLRLREYRSHLGAVFQDNFLFDGTIAENIAYSRPQASRDEVLAAAGVAHCDEFVARFPDGYDTLVGERGVRLSGGQRQRVAIARAILAAPSILILDEATSSLDSESEALIQDGLARLRRGRTTFVIAHRLSTIRAADQILVLEGGEIVERGTHAELLAAGGRYRQLYDRQYRLESDRFVNPGEDFTPEPEPSRPALAPPPPRRL